MHDSQKINVFSEYLITLILITAYLLFMMPPKSSSGGYMMLKSNLGGILVLAVPYLLVYVSYLLKIKKDKGKKNSQIAFPAMLYLTGLGVYIVLKLLP